MNIRAGITIASITGAMNRFFSIAHEGHNKVWAWENNWLPFQHLSLGLFPTILAWHAVANPSTTLLHMSPADVAIAVCCGALIYVPQPRSTVCLSAG
jgi:hypothetical protein